MIRVVSTFRVLAITLLLPLTVATAPRAEGEAAGAEPVVQDTEVDGVKVQLVSAKRSSGGTVTINFKFTNEGSEERTTIERSASPPPTT